MYRRTKYNCSENSLLFRGKANTADFTTVFSECQEFMFLASHRETNSVGRRGNR